MQKSKFGNLIQNSETRHLPTDHPGNILQSYANIFLTEELSAVNRVAEYCALWCMSVEKYGNSDIESK